MAGKIIKSTSWSLLLCLTPHSGSRCVPSPSPVPLALSPCSSVLGRSPLAHCSRGAWAAVSPSQVLVCGSCACSQKGPPCSFSHGRLLVSRTICLLFLERPLSRLPPPLPTQRCPAHSAQSVVKACVCVFVQCPFSSLNTELHEGRDSSELCIWGFLPWPARDRSSSCSASG